MEVLCFLNFSIRLGVVAHICNLERWRSGKPRFEASSRQKVSEIPTQSISQMWCIWSEASLGKNVRPRLKNN
jgi:hypothetical protein